MTRTQKAVVRAAMQPIVWVGSVIRFKENKLVSAFYDAASTGQRFDLNTAAMMKFSRADREQFAQLIGYSVSGYGDLSYASRQSVEKADKIAAAMSRARHLRSQSAKRRKG